MTIWVFAYKYWVISIEIPKAIEVQRAMSASQSYKDESFEVSASNENRYKIGLWIGIIINVVIVTIYISFYGKYCM